MASVQPTFQVPFGIVNLKGLMAMSEDKVIEQPIFAHPTYPITVTLDHSYSEGFGKLKYNEPGNLLEGKSYQKLYRKNVRWDFGDGTEVEGYSATHCYEIPGKYTITCTFFDINRQGIQNGFRVSVIVKQVVPTMLAFDVEESSIEEILCSKIEKIAKIEALLSNNVKNTVNVLAKRIYQEDEEVQDTWDDVKNLEFPHLRKYYCFLKPQKEYYYQTEQVYKESFVPTCSYIPEYEDLYGYFDVVDGKINFNCFRVQPYASKEKMPDIKINNPNASILENEVLSEYPVIDVSTVEELPSEAKFIGRRGFIDIYYRNDFLSDKNTLFFSLDIDNINVHNSIESSTNFLNIPPIGLHLAIIPNDFSDINFSFTLNGFITSFEDVDKLVQLSFVKDYSFNTLLIPYCLSENNRYYIPKDFNFNSYTIRIDNKAENDTLLKQEDDSLSYLRTFTVDCKSKLNSEVSIIGNETKTIIFNYEMKDLDSIILPTEKYYQQNIKKLIDAYTPHELFQHTPILKNVLQRVLENKNMLNYVLTKGMNFFDDNVNFKTSYVSNLLSQLRMMGKDAFEYEESQFEGVNELRDLCRILSMNHSELVGNLIDEDYDIKYTESYKGKHIGEEVLVTDEIYVISENKAVGNNRHQKGKITKVKRKGVELKLEIPTLLVVRDNYTNETKIVNFADIPPADIEANVYYLRDYKDSWGWGLLLPNKQDKEGKVLQSYYSFYLLNPPDHIIRIGNFLQEETITPDIENKEIWEKYDGKTFDKVQKVIHEALDL